MPHQVTVWRWAKKRREIALFLEMRLGKTLVAIRWAKTRPNCKTRLIVAPLAVCETWRRELALEGITDVAALFTGTAKQRARALQDGLDAGCGWFIVNYEGLIKTGHRTKTGRRAHVPSPLAALPIWDVVVLDESTRIRSPRASVSVIANRVLSKAPFKAIMSGLPDPEGCDDFVAQFLFLAGAFMGYDDFWKWRQAHMHQTYGGGWDVKWSSRPKIRAWVRENSYTMTRADAGLRTPKIRSERRVVLPRKVLKAIESALRKFEVGDKLTKTSLTALTWMIQLAGGRFPHDPTLHHDVKIAEVKTLVLGELRNMPIVVWCRHTAEVLAVTDALKKAKVSAASLYGAMTTGARQDAIDSFMAEKTRVLVAQPKCAHVGVNLAIADVAIYYSNWWDEEVRAQSEDRIVHPAKQRPLLLIDIVATDTPDEDIHRALADKDMEARAFMRPFLESVEARARRLKK